MASRHCPWTPKGEHVIVERPCHGAFMLETNSHTPLLVACRLPTSPPGMISSEIIFPFLCLTCVRDLKILRLGFDCLGDIELGFLPSLIYYIVADTQGMSGMHRHTLQNQ